MDHTYHMNSPEHRALVDLRFDRFAHQVEIEMEAYRPAFLRERKQLETQISVALDAHIVYGQFETVRPADTYSINVLSATGRLAYGVSTVNAEHADWTLFDSQEDAEAYQALVLAA